VKKYLFNLIQLIALLLATSEMALAIEYKDILEEPPPPNSPAGVFILYKKAALNEDIGMMRSLAHGTVARFIEASEANVQREIEKAQWIDWTKPVKWAQQIEGDHGKVIFKFLRRDGRNSSARMDFTLIDGQWKYGK